MKQKAVVNKQNTPPLTQRKIRLESVSMKINAVVAPPCWSKLQLSKRTISLFVLSQKRTMPRFIASECNRLLCNSIT